MTLTLYAHPFSSYSQKVLIALWEYGLAFDYRSLDGDPAAMAELKAHWPSGQFPLLLVDGSAVAESSTIIEHLTLRHAAGHPARLIPADPEAALEVRFLDRVFDNHVMTSMQRPVNEALAGGERQETVQAAAEAALDASYGWLETRLAGRKWAAGDAFSLADCAAAPSLFYADWVRPIDDARFPTVRAYRSRLLARPTVARAVDEGRPFRSYFPLGAPDRD